MAVDPRIALGVQPIQIADPLAQYGQVQNILAAQQQMRGAQTQQQMSQMQLENMQRDRDALAKMQAEITKHGGPSDLGMASDQMIKSGVPHYMDLGFKIQEKLQNQRNFESLLRGTPSSTAPPSAAAAPSVAGPSAPIGERMQADWVKNAPAGVSYEQYAASQTTGATAPVAAPTPVVQARSLQAPGVALPPVANQLAPAPVAPTNQLAPQPTANELRQKIDAAYALGTPQALAWAQAREKELAEMGKPQVVSSGASVYIPGQGFVGTAPEKLSPTEMMKNYEFAKSQGFKGSLFDYERQLKEATRAPAQPQPPVAVVDPVTGKQVYVTREQALAGKMTPAAAMEGLAPKEIQAREAKYPAATSAVKTFESSADRLAADLEKLANHPGLSGISGLIAGRTPAVTKDARAAQALYDSIVARGGFQELQNMRSASPTGGALGNVSNQEGQYLRDAFAPINRTQDTADLQRALREAAGATRSSKQRLREAYDMTYDYKNQGGAAVAPATGGKVVDFGSLK